MESDKHFLNSCGEEKVAVGIFLTWGSFGDGE